MFKIKAHKNYLHVQALGKLTHKDYAENLIPKLEQAIDLAKSDKHKLNMLVEVEDLSGWELQAALDDFATGIKHYSDFDKMAIVGDKAWMGALVKFFSVFMRADIKFFELEDKDSARHWVDRA